MYWKRGGRGALMNMYWSHSGRGKLSSGGPIVKLIRVSRKPLSVQHDLVYRPHTWTLCRYHKLAEAQVKNDWTISFNHWAEWMEQTNKTNEMNEYSGRSYEWVNEWSMNGADEVMNEWLNERMNAYAKGYMNGWATMNNICMEHHFPLSTDECHRVTIKTFLIKYSSTRSQANRRSTHQRYNILAGS